MHAAAGGQREHFSQHEKRIHQIGAAARCFHRTCLCVWTKQCIPLCPLGPTTVAEESSGYDCKGSWISADVHLGSTWVSPSTSSSHPRSVGKADPHQGKGCESHLRTVERNPRGVRGRTQGLVSSTRGKSPRCQADLGHPLRRICLLQLTCTCMESLHLFFFHQACNKSFSQSSWVPTTVPCWTQVVESNGKAMEWWSGPMNSCVQTGSDIRMPLQHPRPAGLKQVRAAPCSDNAFVRWRRCPTLWDGQMQA